MALAFNEEKKRLIPHQRFKEEDGLKGKERGGRLDPPTSGMGNEGFWEIAITKLKGRSKAPAFDLGTRGELLWRCVNEKERGERE